MSKLRGIPSFESLGLHPEVVKAAETLGYTEPKPLQLEVISVAIRGRDIMCIPQSGTGRTAAFLLPVLHRLLCANGHPRGCFSVIIVPTQERAAKVVRVIDRMAGVCKWLTSRLLVEGLEERGERMSVGDMPNIIVGTPEYLAAHAEDTRGLLKCAPLLVIDEADKVVEMDTASEVWPIVGAFSNQRATMMFSANMSTEVEELQDVLLRDAARITRTNHYPYTCVDRPMIFVSSLCLNIVMRT